MAVHRRHPIGFQDKDSGLDLDLQKPLTKEQIKKSVGFDSLVKRTYRKLNPDSTKILDENKDSGDDDFFASVRNALK